SEELGVVGVRGEVERAVDPRAPRLQLVVVAQRDGGAPGEGVRVTRGDARAEDVGVGGEAGVDVEVAEVRVPVEVEARAGLPRLGALPGWRGRAPTRRGEDHERDQGRPPHADTVYRTRLSPVDRWAIHGRIGHGMATPRRRGPAGNRLGGARP